MKKKVSLVLLVTLGLFCSNLYAHPAGSINIGYDMKTQILNVEISHKVKNAQKHYIEYIKITVNKEILLIQNFKKQYSKSGQDVSYKIAEISEGDIVIVETKCNYAGKQTKKLKIEVAKGLSNKLRTGSETDK